jgi:hypothetical protein
VLARVLPGVLLGELTCVPRKNAPGEPKTAAPHPELAPAAAAVGAAKAAPVTTSVAARFRAELPVRGRPEPAAGRGSTPVALLGEEAERLFA